MLLMPDNGRAKNDGAEKRALINRQFLIKRLLLSFFITLLLSGCGSGDDLHLSEGGIGGSGISVGPITGFGSVWVNGVRYDTRQASFIRNNNTTSEQASFHVGEVVTIRGSISTDGVTGIADSVSFDNALTGTVDSIDLNQNKLAVLGQTVQTDALTVLHGFNLLSDLDVGNVLEISGNMTADDELYATSIRLLQTSFIAGESQLLVKGKVSQLNQSQSYFNLNGLLVDYASTAFGSDFVLQNGQFVAVESLQAVANNRLTASHISLQTAAPQFTAGQEVELEGFITTLQNGQQFSVNGQPVITTDNTEFEYGNAADLALGTRLEVEGYVNEQAVLVAEEISIRQTDRDSGIELEGTISALNTAQQTLNLAGETIVVDNSTILLDETNDREVSIRFSDLQLNDYLEVTGSRQPNGHILALRIERENENEEEEDDDD